MSKGGFKGEVECALARDAVARQWFPHLELYFPEVAPCHDEGISTRFQRHLDQLSRAGKSPPGHPGLSRFPCIHWDMHAQVWKGEFSLQCLEAPEKHGPIYFTSSSEDGAAKLWDELARVARDKHGLTGDFAERDMNYSSNGWVQALTHKQREKRAHSHACT